MLLLRVHLRESLAHFDVNHLEAARYVVLHLALVILGLPHLLLNSVELRCSPAAVAAAVAVALVDVAVAVAAASDIAVAVAIVGVGVDALGDGCW